MSITKGQVINSILWKYLERCGTQGVQFLVTIILARLLAPEDYGLVAIVTVIVNIANVLVDGGFNKALIQKKHSDQIDFSTIFIFSLLFSLILYGILFIGSSYIADFYNSPQLKNIIRILSLCVLFYSVNSIQQAYVAKHMLFKKLFYCTFISVIISGVFSIYLAYQNFGVWALVSYTLLNTVLTTLLLFVFVGWRPEIKFSFMRFKTLFSFGWKILLANLQISLFLNIRSLIIGKVFSKSSLAFFDRGKMFPELIMLNINNSIQSVIFPVLSDCQNDKTKVKDIVRRATKTCCLVIFPLMVGLIVIAKPLVFLLLTEKWEQAVPFVQIFAASFLFMPPQLVNLEAIKSLGYSGITLKLETYKKVLEFSILIVSCYFGVLAIAWGVVLYNFICLFINLAPNRKLLSYGYIEQIKDIIPMLVSSVVMGGIIYWVSYFNFSNIITIILQLVLGLIIYILICYMSKNESFFFLYNLILKRNNHK